jgi:maltose alpha-D-glucosyltransferase/alpha-amylase
LEMVTEEERQWMWQEYAPDARMRLNLGIRRRLAPLLDNDPAKVALAYSLLFSMPGSPIIYYGDEIGMGDNIWLFDRNGVRTPMQWISGHNAGFSTADPSRLYAPVIQGDDYGPQQVNVNDQKVDPASLLSIIRRMITVRKGHPAFGQGEFAWVKTSTDAVAACLRTHPIERLLVVNNLARSSQEVSIPLPPGSSLTPYELLRGVEIPATRDASLVLTLNPLEYLWLKLN